MEATKAVSLDVNTILKLQDKLTSIKNKIHYWSAKSKVFEQNGACNFDSFMKNSQLTPSKRTPKSRGLRQQDWTSLNYSQQYEVLHNVALDHSRVTLNFEGLAMAIKASQASEALKNAIGLEETTETGDKIDPDEKKYLLELLEEQAELTDSILKAEDDQLNAKLELINVKSELLKEFDSLREKYSALLKNNPENDIEPAVHRKRQKEIQMDKEMEVLKAEEDRLNEIRILIQKLLMSVPQGCLNYDEETNKKHKSMLSKCGEDLPTLRGD